MRSALIRILLPLGLCILLVLAAVVVGLSVPRDAVNVFVNHLGPLEYLMLGSGTLLFVTQVALSFQALKWKETSFDAKADRWINHLSGAAEWFPLLGLLGTVAGILHAFSASQGERPIQPREIAPALSATGAGLFMAFINILPAWMVILGRDLILALSGGSPQTTVDKG